MFKKYLVLVLTILVVILSTGTAIFAAETKAEKELKFAEKVKTELAKLGTGKDTKVEVRLKDKTKVKGYISQINENSFVVVDSSDKSTVVFYPKVKQVTGKNNLTGKEIAIFAAAILLLIFIASRIGAA